MSGVPDIREIGVEEFVRRLRTDANGVFAFFIGAGCSVTSGIPSAGELVRDSWIPRLRDLIAPNRTDLDTWANEELDDYDSADPARSYGDLIGRLFLTPAYRQREIEYLCEGRTPSFGYAVLAQLIALDNGLFNVVLTTNFDDLIADALYLYTESRPLIIHHEALAPYIRPTRTRPLIVKLHGDHRLSPLNTFPETQQLPQELQRNTAMLLHDRGVIFIGYGGSDNGILRLLDELPREALPYGAYWVNPLEPQGQVRAWLSSRQGFWVRGGSFDEVMLLLRDSFELPHPNADRFNRIFEDYQQKYLKFSASIDRKPVGELEAKVLKEIIIGIDAQFPDFWKVISEAQRLENTNPDLSSEIYQLGVSRFPNAAPLLGNFALFLKNVRREYNVAESMFKRAVEADSRHAGILGNYAIFLKDIRNDYDQAETMYKRAVEADSRHAGILGNYAIFLKDVRNDYDAAESMYKRALEADPKHADNLGNYATFLKDIRNDYDQAETMYKRALEADPKHANNLGNYATFLSEISKKYDAAETIYKRALEADPKHADNLGNYATFLKQVRNDYDPAEKLFQLAMGADPKHAGVLGKYAIFLYEVRNNYDAAEKLFQLAVEADPKHADNLGNYATFLKQARNAYDAAETMYKRALEADPKHANNLGNYAIFLNEVRRNYDAAETMYKRALDADPKNAGIRNNYSNFLKSNRK